MKPDSPTVFIVSKPLAPPWSDSSKNLAKDIALFSSKTRFKVLGTPSTPLDKPNIIVERIFNSQGAYQPSFLQNLKMAFRLLQNDPDVDIYHFFFAPNLMTSTVLRWIMKFKKQKTIHTICSQPNSANWTRLLFADQVVVLTDFLQKELRQQGKNARCIYPGISTEVNDASNQLQSLHKSSSTLALYPGDYEFSQGHEFLLDILPEILKDCPNFKLIFACRKKTSKAQEIEKAFKQKCCEKGADKNIVFLNEVEHFKSLIKTCDFTLFPGRSLYRKMDFPLALLESLLLERPVLASDLPSLKELFFEAKGGYALSLSNKSEWVEKIIAFSQDATLRHKMGASGKALVKDKFSIAAVAKQYEQLYRELIAAEGSLKQTKTYYEQFSKHYESRRHAGYHALLDDLESGMIKKYGQQKKVLEVGCGTGLIMQRVQSEVQSVVGVDLTYGMASQARDKGFRVFQATATALPLPSESFDLTYSFKTLAHVPQIKKAVEEMARVTKPGGVVVAEFYNRFSIRALRWFFRKKLISLLRPKKMTEKDIFTRYDSLEEIKSYLPKNVHIKAIEGAIVWTPLAVFFKIPLIAQLLHWLETRCRGGVMKYFSGFLTLVLEKDDSETLKDSDKLYKVASTV